MNKYYFLPSLCLVGVTVFADEPQWPKHVVHSDVQTMTAVASDFTGDGLPDVIADSGNKTRLFVAPDWTEVILDEHPKGRTYIHSESFDIDGDGDLDYIGARYNPGLIVWLEQPEDGANQRWQRRQIDDQVHGIHGLIKGDVDGDGKYDLLATSAQDKPPFPESLAWFQVPSDPKNATSWRPNIFAVNDAPGLTHYLGVGDVNGDGRLDAATGAKGGPSATSTGDWFAWWEAPSDPTAPWRKHLISDDEPGATNIHPVDVNGDGQMDFIASRGHGRGVVWFEGPSFKRHDIDADIKEPHCLVAVDLDGDGDVDAATCAYGDKVAVWYENDGHGKFARHLIGEDQESYDIRAVDMDVDGDLDLLIAGRGSKNVVWYEQPSRWLSLFDGESLEGWEANLAPKSFRVVDGAIRMQATTKKKSHLFYVGENPNFKNFELQATVRAEPNSNGGIFFHTDRSTRDRHKHLAKGYEVQLNSSESERRKTGSLYAIVDFHESPVDETEWFTVNITVLGKAITVKINDQKVVEYTEPENPVREKSRQGRLLSAEGGMIALQAHDQKSVWYLKELKIRRLEE